MLIYGDFLASFDLPDFHFFVELKSWLAFPLAAPVQGMSITLPLSLCLDFGIDGLIIYIFYIRRLGSTDLFRLLVFGKSTSGIRAVS